LDFRNGPDHHQEATMKRIGMTAFALALVAIGTAAMAAESTSDRIRRAAPKGITEAFYTCIDKANSDDIEEAACISQEREQQDRRLNATYQKLLRKLGSSQKKSLVQAERAWLQFRDSSIGFESALYPDETVSNLELAQNELFFICRRADDLNRYLLLASE